MKNIKILFCGSLLLSGIVHGSDRICGKPMTEHQQARFRALCMLAAVAPLDQRVTVDVPAFLKHAEQQCSRYKSKKRILHCMECLHLITGVAAVVSLTNGVKTFSENDEKYVRFMSVGAIAAQAAYTLQSQCEEMKQELNEPKYALFKEPFSGQEQKFMRDVFGLVPVQKRIGQ